MDAKLPAFLWFIEKAEQIVDRYMTPDAYEQALYSPLATPNSQDQSSKSQEEQPTAHHLRKKDLLEIAYSQILSYSRWSTPGGSRQPMQFRRGDIGRVWEIMKVSLT